MTDIRKFTFPLPPDLLRAEVYALPVESDPLAVVVLCPGFNWNGGDWVAKREWQEFATANQLGLIGLSFASDQSIINQERGYYYASKGSGDLLLDAVREIYGKDLPLLLYGFSGGAHFASRFVEWKPAQVTGWCAYSAAWWDVPRPQTNPPPGIVACGGADDRLKVCRDYFVQGRDLGNPWLWLTVPGIKHATTPGLEDFVRQYFLSLLKPAGESCWVHIDTKAEISPVEADQTRPTTGWAPCRSLVGMWRDIQESATGIQG